MKPITILLMGRRKSYRCWICQDTGWRLLYWKRGGVWCTQRVPCECQPKKEGKDGRDL